MNRLYIFVLIAFLLWFIFIREGEVVLGPGVKVKEFPVQEMLKGDKGFIFKDYTIVPLAEFRMMGKVLGKENYRFDSSAELSPVDLALGWGRMSDEKVLEKLDINQSGRWYRWYTDNYPIPRKEIESCSANMHMIPANIVVENQLDKVIKGCIVKIKGKLVSVSGKNNFRWKSSLSRDDTGDGACEVVFLEDITVVDPG